MLTKEQKRDAFLKGMGSIYDLYPPLPSNRIANFTASPLPSVSLENCWEEVGSYLRQSMKDYEQEESAN